MTPVELVVSKLRDAKRNGHGWQAKCPAHDDRQPSLSIAAGDDGRALLRCHAGCTVAAVAAALGLRLADLMPATDPTAARKGTRKPPAPPAKTYRTAAEAAAQLERQHGKAAARWTYYDAAGEPVGVVLRWDTPDGKTIRPVSWTPRGWIVGGMPEPRPLYRLPELLARPGERVYVSEGEKAADAAASVGLLATTSPHGSKSADKTDWRPLAGRDVVILPDHDEPGRQYADNVAHILSAMNRPATVRVVDLPELPDGGDMVEYLDARGGAEPEAIRAEVGALADQAEPIKPETMPECGPVLLCMADVEPKAIAWLWPNRIPLGRITLLVGRPGEGKSFLTTDIAARVTTGSPWPDGCGNAPRGTAILISAEDDPADTIRPRLDAHHADVAKVHLLSAVRRLDDDGKPLEIMFTLADVVALESAMRLHPDCRLIVVDPIGSFLGSKTDAHRDNEVRGVLAPVARLAEKYGAAVLVVAHRRKSSGSNADETALGSRAFTGIARAVWHLSRDSRDKNRRLLLPGKNNLAPEGDGLAFAIEGDPPRLFWEHDPVCMSADDALAAENRGDTDRPGPEPEAQHAAADWLTDLLAAGPVPSGNTNNPEPGTVRSEAKQAGLSWTTVRRASDKLGVVREKIAFSGAWQWRLPKLLTEVAQRPREQENLSNLSNLAFSTPPEPIFNLSNIEVAQDLSLEQLGTIPAGWTPETWVRELRGMAGVCESTNPELAAQYRRQADDAQTLEGVA